MQERMEEGLCRLAAAAITQRAVQNVKRRCALGGTTARANLPAPLSLAPHRSLADEAATAIQSAERGRQARARVKLPAPRRRAELPARAALALAALALLLLLLLPTLLGVSLTEVLCPAAREGAAGGWRQSLCTRSPPRSAYDGPLFPTCGTQCAQSGVCAANAARMNAQLDASQAELQAARASTLAAAQVQLELEAARGAAASAARIKAELEAARGAAAAAASMQSQLEAAKAELHAARAAASAEAKVQAELELARAAAAAAAAVQNELQQARAAARVQEELDKARLELDAAKASAAASARLKAELELASAASAISSKVQAELSAAKAVAEAASRVQAELDAVRASSAAAEHAKSELDSAKSSSQADARLRAELSAAKMAACATRKVQTELDGAKQAASAALRTQIELQAARRELEEARAIASSATAVRAGLNRARAAAAEELRGLPPPSIDVLASAPAAAAASPTNSEAGLGSVGSLGAVALFALGLYGLGLESPKWGLAGPLGRKTNMLLSAAPATTLRGWSRLRALADTPRAAGQSEWRLRAAVARGAPSTAAAAGFPASGVARQLACRRASRILVLLATDEGGCAGLDGSLAALDALRRLSQSDVSAATLLPCGAVQAALSCLLHHPESVHTAWHACTLLGNLALQPALQPQLLAHPELTSGRAILLTVKALMLHAQQDARVAGAASGAVWTLMLAMGPAGAELAFRAGALPLLLSACEAHAANGVIVYNSVGSLLTLAQSCAEVRTVLREAQAGAKVRGVLEAHGGLTHLYGPAVAGSAASWM